MKTRSRGWCALALVCFAACSFPDYEVAESVPPAVSCKNQVLDGDEEKVDCGGPCQACHCRDQQKNVDEVNVDCGGSCDACPTCGNGTLDADETGIDCGGPCPACPSCDDALLNGSESDVDCGGSCERCDDDERCTQDADCQSLVCDRVCQPPDCRDGVRNGAETGLDCGGGCLGCPNGSACKEGDDCQSARCADGICVDAGCTDGVVNGKETDKDCGGTECAPCAAPGKCKVESDCESKICPASGLCSAPSCSDEVQNQDESWPDCGGSLCGGCEIGEGCDIALDCLSGICLRGTCVPENPSGQPLARTNWKLSSSAGSTESGTDKVFDGDDSSQWTSGTNQHAKMYFDLDLGKESIFFKVLLKEVSAPHDQEFPGYIDAYVSSDGTFGEPTKPHVQGNQWLWVDFQTAQVGRYLRFEITEPLQRAWSFGEIYVYN